MNVLWKQLFKKRGIWDAFGILEKEIKPVLIKDLQFRLEEGHSYGLAFYRSRELFQQLQLVDYVLDEQNRKCVILTPKGRQVWQFLEGLQ